jgi:hypothetical protein
MYVNDVRIYIVKPNIFFEKISFNYIERDQLVK